MPDQDALSGDARSATDEPAEAAPHASAPDQDILIPTDLDDVVTEQPRPVPPEVLDATADELAAALEAVCFALNRPLTVGEAAVVLGRPRADVAAAVEVLAVALRGRGLMLQRHHDELQLVTRPEVAWAVQRALNPERPGRLSRAALETLAIVAYRQPITRAGLEAIRGVNCDAVLEGLERRDLVVEVGRQDTPGHPRLFGTTLRFLQVVGLERIEDLPPLPEGVVVPEFVDDSWAAAEVEEVAEADGGATVAVGGRPVGPEWPPPERADAGAAGRQPSPPDEG